jgi:cytochrome b561
MIRNSSTSWGWPAIVLHWIGAVLIVLLLGHGWWMTHLAPRPDRLVHYAGHAALGYDFLVLLILRLLWRWLNPVPALPGEAWERYAAKFGHIALYVLMLACALTGWALAGTFRSPLNRDVFGFARPVI